MEEGCGCLDVVDEVRGGGEFDKGGDTEGRRRRVGKGRTEEPIPTLDIRAGQKIV
jgi:hypothetical protein